MSAKCTTVVFSNRAYNAIIRETFEKDPIETGGILLGHVVDGVWVVMEVLPPGINSIFKIAYFEYDEEFVNYLAHSVANQYKQPLSLLGLWHRHPGNMDVFSGTDDETNRTFAKQLPHGVISGLVNVDPHFRFTMYYLNAATDAGVGRPKYETIDIEVGDDIIPEEFFELKYLGDIEKSNLHPTMADSKEHKYTAKHSKKINPANVNHDAQNIITYEIKEGLGEASTGDVFLECGKRLFRLMRKYWKELLIAALVICLFVLGKSLLTSKQNPENPKSSAKVVLKVDTLKKDTIGTILDIELSAQIGQKDTVVSKDTLNKHQH